MPDNEEERKRRKIDEQKEIFYAATKEWMDEKLAKFGWFSIRFLGALVLFLIVRGAFSLHSTDIRDFLEASEKVHQITQ